MKFRLMLFVTLFALVTLGRSPRCCNATNHRQNPRRGLSKEVRHELLMLPYFWRL